jgi:hypothetical protein
VNGTYVCRDALRFVPFNSHVVRFHASFPLTIAVRLADGEESLGVGVESPNRVGDAGFIARFVDASGKLVAQTDAGWRCRPVYVAPLDGPGCLAGFDTSACATKPACVANGAIDTCQAAHYPVDPAWAAGAYDASGWLAAKVYTAADVGPKTAFTSESARFSGASFIWSANLFVDDEVLCRTTVARP